MTRALAATLLALGLLVTGCGESNQSGDSNTDTQTEQEVTPSPSSSSSY